MVSMLIGAAARGSEVHCMDLDGQQVTAVMRAAAFVVVAAASIQQPAAVRWQPNGWG